MNMIGHWETASLETIIQGAYLNRRLKRYTKAIEILERGGSALGTTAELYPQMILAYGEAGDMESAKSVWDLCSRIEKGPLEKCRVAAGGLAPPPEKENPPIKWLNEI